MEPLKTLADLCAPDARQLSRVSLNKATGEIRPISLQDHYAAIERIVLDPYVPEEHRDNFQTARHLLIYSWYVYRFVTVAEMHAYACLEYALGDRLPLERRERARGLKRRLTIALEERWLTDDAFGDWLPDAWRARGAEQPDDQRFLRMLCENLPELRNSLAHGTPSVWPGGYQTLGLIAGAINRLFATVSS